MLVSALLNMRYTGPWKRDLPPGARHVIKPSAAFTAQTSLFITDFQKGSREPFLLKPSGSVSPLPIGKTREHLRSYTIFALYNDLVLLSASMGDPDPKDTLLTRLKLLPHLHNLDSMFQEDRPLAPSETGPGIVTGPTGPGLGTSEGF
jgi:hypothetical protein